MLNTHTIIEEINNNDNPYIIDIRETENKEEKKKNESESNLIEVLTDYMEGRLHSEIDLSYDWIVKEPNISKINNSIVADLEQVNGIMSKRDFGCELKLLKLITEDDEHKEMLINIPKTCRKLNRYPDILPYKHNTVFLDKKFKNKTSKEEITAEEILNSYINASYISGPLQEDKAIFIATQGPVTCTIEAFWKMILKENTKLIIILTNLQEENRNKSELYWPVNEDNPLIIGKFTIYLQTEVVILDKAIIQRNIIIENSTDNIRHSVTQLHVICWPDHLVPEEEIGFKMIEMVMTYVVNYRNENRQSPVVVHCSAGLGRTGTFIAIYNICKCLTIMDNYNKTTQTKNPPFFSVFNTVRKLREERFSMVTDSIQYKYIYQYVIEWIKRNFEI